MKTERTIGKNQVTTMTVFKKQKSWFINNWRLQNYLLFKKRVNRICMLFAKCINQLQSIHPINGMQFMGFMQLYTEPHSNPCDILHDINEIKHIINLSTSCDIPKITVYQKEGNDSTGQWFKGEPIWNTIKQNNLTSAGLQYPGTNANCGGRIINGTDLSGYPTYYKPIYHFDWPFQDRINLTIDLLNSNEPNYDLVLLYFEQPDHHGHVFGPISDEVVNAVQLMDEYIGKLMTQMEENGLLDITDVILFSDHGMTSIEKYNPETYLNEDSKIIVINESVFPFDEVIIRDYAPVMGVYLKDNSERFSDVNEAMDLMRDAMVHNGDKPGIYSNGNNIESDRIPDFIVDAELGYMFYVKGYYSPNTSLGTHGYNNSKEDMFGIFMARGPSFKNGYVVDDNYLENTFES